MQKITLVFSLLIIAFVANAQTANTKEDLIKSADASMYSNDLKTADTVFTYLFKKYPGDSLVIRKKANLYWQYGRAYSKKPLLEESIKLFTELDSKYANNAEIKLYLATAKVKYSDLQFFDLKAKESDQKALLPVYQTAKIEIEKYAPKADGKIKQIAIEDLSNINSLLKAN